MSWLPATIQERLVIVLAHFVWQGVAVAALLAALVALLNLKRPSVRYASSLLAFVLMAACPFVTWFVVPDFGVRDVSPAVDQSHDQRETVTEFSEPEGVSPRTAHEWNVPGLTPSGSPEADTVNARLVDDRPHQADSHSPGNSTTASNWLDTLRPFEPWVIGVWLCGVGLLSLRLLLGAIGLWRWRRAVEMLPGSFAPIVDRLSAALSMAQPRVRVCRRVAEAVAIGLFKPMILLPAAWLAELPPDMLEAVLAHELAHVRRLDLWVNLLQRLVETLLFYHPAVWWLSRRLRVERELCCDELAATVTNDRIRYAETLEHVARLTQLSASRGSRDPAFSVAMSGREGVLLHRIRQLLDVTAPPRTSSGWLAGLLTLGLVLTIALGTLVSSRAEIETPTSERDTNLRAERGSPDPALNPTAGLPNSDEDTNPTNNANGDLRSNPAAGSGDTRRAQVDNTKDDPQTNQLEKAVTYKCRVVTAKTNAPIAGAKVVFTRTIVGDPRYHEYEHLVEKSEHITDADGWYEVTITPEQLAERYLYLRLVIFHSEHIATRPEGYAMSMIRKNEKAGGRPFFQTMAMTPGKAVTGRVVTPEGKPAANVRIKARGPYPHPLDWTQTDKEGRFHMVLKADGPDEFWLMPDDFSPSHHVVDQQRSDMGTLKLAHGIRQSGRLLDSNGQPVAGLLVNVEQVVRKTPDAEPVSFPGYERDSVTDAEGRFTLAPVNPGDYALQISTNHRSPGAPPKFDGVFLGQTLTIDADTKSLEVRAVPAVEIRVRNVDSSGAPKRGFEFSVVGWVGERPFDTVSDRPTDGHCMARVPRGLSDVYLGFPDNEHGSVRVRRKPGAPFENIDELKLPVVEADVEGIEVARYTAPIVLVKAVDANNQPIADFKPEIKYAPGRSPEDRVYQRNSGVSGDVDFEHQEDGRWRSRSLLPDEDLTVTVIKEGWKSEPQKLRMAEGTERELVFVLKEVAAKQNTDDGQSKSDNANGDLRSNPAAGSGDPRRAQTNSLQAQEKSAGHFNGRVTGPDGRPLSRARVFVAPWTENLKTSGAVRAETDAEGRFEFDAPDMTYTNAEGRRLRKQGVLVATADGFAADWMRTWGDNLPGFRSHADPVEGAALELRLAKSDVPIEGRFLNHDGTPLVGARVELVGVMIPQKHDLDAHIVREVNFTVVNVTDYERELYKPGLLPGLVLETKTDAAGRFQLSGLGRDRLAWLKVSAPNVADTELEVMTRDAPDVRTRLGDELSKKLNPMIYGAKFTLTLKPRPEARAGLDPAVNQNAQADAGITAAELEKLIQASGRELFFGRMELAQEFEMLWPTKDQKHEKVKSKGTVRWLKNTRLTRIESDRMVPGTGTTELHLEKWTTGHDGVQAYSWNRAAKLISYGAMRPGAVAYSPNLLFWGRSAIAYPQPIFGTRPEITRITRNGREEIDVVVVHDVPGAKFSVSYLGIASNRGYLPTRVEQRSQGRLEALTEFQDFFQPHPGVWAPKTIVWTAWSADNDANGKPIVAMSSKFTVTKLELGDNAKLQDEEFQLKLPDDVKVVDAATANAATNEAKSPPTPRPQPKPDRKNADEKPADSGAQTIAPLLEFRFAAQPANSKFEPRAPADYEKGDYSGNTAIGRIIAKDKGFIWVPVAESKNRIAALPVERTFGGQVREALLADTPEHALPFNFKWSIKDCRVVPAESVGPVEQFAIELKLDEAGGAALRTLTKSHRNQPLAILVKGDIIAAPIVHEEFGQNIAITGNFTREQADTLAKTLLTPTTPQQAELRNKKQAATERQVVLRDKKQAAMERIVRGRVLDADGKPVAGANVVYPYMWIGGAGSYRSVMGASDENGEYRLPVPLESLPEKQSVSAGQMADLKPLLWVWASAKGVGLGVSQLRGNLSRSQQPEPVDIKLRPLKPSKFQLLDPEKRPLAGARCEITTAATDGISNMPIPHTIPDTFRISAQSGEDGSGLIELLPPELFRAIHISHPKYGRQLVEFTEQQAASPSLLLTFGPATRVTGRIEAKTPDFFRGLELRMQTSKERFVGPSSELVLVPVDEQGRFDIVLPHGRLEIIAQRDDSDDTGAESLFIPTDVVIDASTKELTLRTKETIKLRGRLVNADDDQPLANAILSITEPHLGQQRPTINAQGEFDFRAFPGETSNIRIGSPIRDESLEFVEPQPSLRIPRRSPNEATFFAGKSDELKSFRVKVTKRAAPAPQALNAEAASNEPKNALEKKDAQPPTSQEGIIESVSGKAIEFNDGLLISIDADTKYTRLTDKGEEPAERKELKSGIRVRYERAPGIGATKVVILPTKPDDAPQKDEPAKAAKENPPAKQPPLEFRIVATAADRNADGVAWLPIIEPRMPLPAGKSGIDLPVEEKVDNKWRGLLWNKAEHALLADGTWRVVKCDVVPVPDAGAAQPRFSIQFTLDAAGGAALRRLTKAHLNQPLAIVVEGTIIAAPTIRSEIGESGEITGQFSREQADKLAAAIRAGIAGNKEPLAMTDRARIELLNDVELQAPQAGMIESLKVTAGAKVKKDDVLAVIKDADSSKSEVVEAPLDGEVLKLFVKNGATVKPNQLLVRLVSFDRVVVVSELKLPGRSPNDLSAKVEITLGDKETLEFPAKVTFLEPQADANGDKRVRVEVQNRQKDGQWLLIPGQTAKLTIWRRDDKAVIGD